MVKINYNNQERDYTVSLPIEQVNSLYEALRIFDNFLYAPRNFISLKLNEGTLQAVFCKLLASSFMLNLLSYCTLCISKLQSYVL